MPSKLELLLQLVKAKKGAYGAQRVERAADEIKNLEKLYSPEALQGAFLGDNAKALMSMPTKSFERYAVPLSPSSNLKLEFVEGLPAMTRDEYIKYLSNVKGLADVPYLEIGQKASGQVPYIAGHEGRHRMRALNQAGQESGLVVLQPRYELREPLPRRSQEEYINALRQEIGTKPVVSPELAKSASPEVRPDIELPEIYKQGGKVSQDAMHLAVMNQKVQKKADGGDIVDDLIREAKSKQQAPRAAVTPVTKESPFEKDFRQYLANQQAAREQVLTELPSRLVKGAIPGAGGALAGYAAQIPGAAGDIASLYQEMKPESWPNIPEKVVQYLPTTEKIQQYLFPEDKTSPEFQAGITGGNIAALGQGIASLPAAAKGIAKGTVAGSKSLAQEIDRAMMTGEGPLAGVLTPAMPRPLITWHGSPHRFPPTERNPLGEFDPTKIGTGEGAQAYGHGHYLAENPATAKYYANALAVDHRDAINKVIQALPEKPTADDVFFEMKRHPVLKDYLNSSQVKNDIISAKSGAEEGGTVSLDAMRAYKRLDKLLPPPQKSFYKVDLPDEAIAKMLDWDKPLSEQPESVKKFVDSNLQENIKKAKETAEKVGVDFDPQSITGRDIYSWMTSGMKNPSEGSNLLQQAGIPGIKYLDQSSRSAGEGTRNFVVFPGGEDLMKIVGREKKGGAIHKAKNESMDTMRLAVMNKQLRK